MNVLELSDISIQFGGVVALDKVSLAVPAGSIFALIGPNGAGKTTLFNVISGVYRATTGQIRFKGENVTGLTPTMLARKGLTRTFQNLQIFFRMSATENVMVGCHQHERLGFLPHLLGLPSVRRQNAESRDRAHALLRLVGLDEVKDRVAGDLPYGALKRLEIARAIAAQPSTLLLDEPVAGCNPVESSEVADVIRKVAATGVTVILVEHDMHVVMNLCHRIHVLDRGRSIANGTPDEIRQHPDVIQAYLGSPKSRENARAIG